MVVAMWRSFASHQERDKEAISKRLGNDKMVRLLYRFRIIIMTFRIQKKERICRKEVRILQPSVRRVPCGSVQGQEEEW
jgi:hypothetical protein